MGRTRDHTATGVDGRIADERNWLGRLFEVEREPAGDHGGRRRRRAGYSVTAVPAARRG